MRKVITGVIILSIFGLLIGSQINVSASENNTNKEFLQFFPKKEKVVIGCYNTITLKTRKADACYSKGDLNIILPTQAQITIWLKYFNKNEIINRLALINFESSFNPNAGNTYAYGYVQTLKKYGIAPDIDTQLQWLKTRQSAQKVEYTAGGSKRCGIYWKNYNYKDGFEAGEYGVLSCLYRYHYHSRKGVWYSKRGIKATKFYKENIFNKVAQYK